MADVELAQDVESSVQDILDLEIGELKEVELPEGGLKSYFVRIPIRQETYQALKKIKESKGLTWDGTIRWLIDIARAKKSQLAVKCPEKEEDMSIEKVAAILKAFGIDLGTVLMALGGGKSA